MGRPVTPHNSNSQQSCAGMPDERLGIAAIRPLGTARSGSAASTGSTMLPDFGSVASINATISSPAIALSVIPPAIPGVILLGTRRPGGRPRGSGAQSSPVRPQSVLHGHACQASGRCPPTFCLVLVLGDGSRADDRRPGLASDMRVVFFGNTPDKSQPGLIFVMLHRY